MKPLSKKENRSPSCQHTRYAVWFSWYCIEFKDLDNEYKWPIVDSYTEELLDGDEN